MRDWRELARLPDGELARYDIAEVNLACAAGLPGSEKIDVDFCLQSIAKWGDHIRSHMTDAAFRRNPKRWKYCPPIYYVHAMMSFLQAQFGVRYNPAKIPTDVPLDLDDLFIHGIFQGEGGTCGTVPVVYVSVGRRLGYPLKLVSCHNGRWGHFFFRWDDPNGDRINCEVNNHSLSCPSDDEYRSGDFTTRQEWERTGSILRSKTPKEELAAFLDQRAGAWWHAGNKRLSVEASAWALALAPANVIYRSLLEKAFNDWAEDLAALKPPDFPGLRIIFPPRHFPESLPYQYECDYFGLSVTEFLLKDPVNDQKWWAPMRRRAALPKKLARVSVRCGPHGYDVCEEHRPSTIVTT